MGIKDPNGYLNLVFLLNFPIVKLSKFGLKECIEGKQIGCIGRGEGFWVVVFSFSVIFRFKCGL